MVAKQSKLLSSLALITGGGVAFTGLNIVNGNESFYRDLFIPVIHKFIDAERAHSMAISMAKYSIVPRNREDSLTDDDSRTLLETQVWGKTFSNPIGLAAGFDKDAEGLVGLSKMGFGFIEVGSVTPQPQSGNEKPRVFRLKESKGIINRLVHHDHDDQVNDEQELDS